MAYPGYLIVDGRGIVTEKFFGEKYTDRFTANNVMAKLFPELLEVVRRPVAARCPPRRDAEAVGHGRVPGSRVTLVVDVALPPDVHVYAPGAADFIPRDAWRSTACPASPSDPRCTRVHNAPARGINQTVPVYSGRFRLTRDVILPGDNPIFNRQLGHDRAAPRPLVVPAG